jgi:hypothetical protein
MVFKRKTRIFAHVWYSRTTVAYVYAESRESAFPDDVLDNVLEGFTVLVSDFHLAYDCVPCEEVLSRIVGRRDLSQVALVEQRELDRARLGEALHRGRSQGGDPVEPRLDGLLEARLRDHAAITDQHHRSSVNAA